MTTFTQSVVASFPAYDIVARQADENGFVEIVANEKLGLEGKGYYKIFFASSVATYAKECGEDPIEAVADAVKRNHELYWINATGCALTAHKQAKKVLVKVSYGMKVLFEGKRFTIEEAFNDNLKLVEIK